MSPEKKKLKKKNLVHPIIKVQWKKPSEKRNEVEWFLPVLQCWCRECWGFRFVG